MARNDDGLHQVGNIWHFRYRSNDGTWKKKSTGKARITDARSIRAKFLEDLRNGQLPNNRARWTVEQALDDWLEYRQSTKARSTLPPERTSVRHLKQHLGSKRRLETITEVDIRRYQAARRKVVGPKTVNNELLVLIGSLRQARLWKRLEEEYKALPVPKQGPGQALTPEDGKRLIETAMKRPAWDVALCATVLAYGTGLRSWEIKSLRLRDVVLDANPPMVRVRRENTKTDAGARDVALSDISLWAAQRLRRRAELLGAVQPDHFLLPANLSKHTKKQDPMRGKGYDPTRHQTSWQTAWENLREENGIKTLRFHDLRHSFITQGVECGVPIEVMMAQVGHVSVEMTRYYTHLTTRAKQDAGKRVADMNPGIKSLLEIDADPK